MPEPISQLRIERVPYGHPDALLLIEEVQAEYVVRYGGRDETPLDPAMFDPPGGSFFVGYLVTPEGVDLPVATGAWRMRSDVEALGSRRTAEGKRMYVVGSARGAGHARAMLAHMERTAARGRRRGDDPGDRACPSTRGSRSTSRPATSRSRASATTGTSRTTGASPGVSPTL